MVAVKPVPRSALPKGSPPGKPLDLFFGKGWNNWTRVLVAETGYCLVIGGEVRKQEVMLPPITEYMFPKVGADHA